VSFQPDPSIARERDDDAWQSCHSLVVKWLSDIFRPGAAIARLGAVAAIAVVEGCSYRAGFNELPFTRSVTWFSYASAQDIRTQCTPGRDRYRVFYNGNWAEQVRTYDLRPSATGSGAVLDERVFAGGAGFTFTFPISSPLDDPLAPARAVDASTRLSEADYRALLAALAADGLGQPGPANARLNSWQFYWAAAACVDGNFTYNAWVYPTARFRDLTFPGPLLAHDQTGVRVNPPRRTEGQSNQERDNGIGPLRSDFTIQLNGDGLPIHLPSL
jgi:hypothetical protein